jgi:glycosyltransferase involved in cell wall biosynthesis
MKVLHFIMGKGNKNRPNGVNQVIAGLCKYSSINGTEIRVIGLASNADLEGEIITRDNFEVIVYSRWSRDLIKELTKQIKWCDITHIHGVYNIHNIIVAKLANKYLRPYVITAHNGFSPNLSKKRKKFFDYFMQRKHIENAAAIHVLAQEEATDILKIFSPKSFVYVPNGIDLDDFPIKLDGSSNIKISGATNTITIGYLGRISKEKNLSALIKALSNIQSKYIYCLKIAGPKSQYLKKIIKESEFLNIEWVGPKYNEDKVSFIKSLDLFVHPSKTDVFSISAMECLAIGTPLLITRESNASYFYNSRGFFMCESSSYGIMQGIQEAVKRKHEWSKMSENGKILVSEIFNWNRASLTIKHEYMRIINKAK